MASFLFKYGDLLVNQSVKSLLPLPEIPVCGCVDVQFGVDDVDLPVKFSPLMNVHHKHEEEVGR
jgi:hypothetical protein